MNLQYFPSTDANEYSKGLARAPQKGAISRSEVEGCRLSFNLIEGRDKIVRNIHSLNLFLKSNLPGLGWMATDPEENVRDPYKLHFVLWADDTFFEAYQRALREVEIN